MTHCYHCEEEQDLVNAFCAHDDESLHCPEHAQKCDSCGRVFCKEILTDDRDSGFNLCEICNDPTIIAAMLAMSGTQKDLRRYLKQRKTA